MNLPGLPYGSWTMEYASLTGDIKDGQVGCSCFGTTFYARPLFMTAFQSLPSKAWLDTYKNQFFALVGYEKNEKNRPILLGLVPINNELYQGTNVEDKHKIQTEKYLIVADDANDNYYIKGNKLNLGSEDAAEPVPLGQTLVNKLNDLIQILQTGKVMTAIGPQPFMPDTQAKLTEWVEGISSILSKKTKTD